MAKGVEIMECYALHPYNDIRHLSAGRSQTYPYESHSQRVELLNGSKNKEAMWIASLFESVR